jgi:hypothetical protein
MAMSLKKVPYLQPLLFALDFHQGPNDEVYIHDLAKGKLTTHSDILFTQTDYEHPVGDLDDTGPDYIKMLAADSGHLNFLSADNFSIFMWIYVTDLSGAPRLIMRGDATSGWQFYIDANGKVYFITDTAGGNETSTTANGAVSINNWTCVSMSREGTTITIYIDGSADTPTQGTHNGPDTSNDDFLIGTQSDAASNPFDGMMGDIYIVGKETSAVDALAYYQMLRHLYLGGQG